MKETLVSFKTAKLAKEKGFNIPCKYFYKEKYINTIEYEVVHDGHLEANWNENFKYSLAECSAPTQSLLQKYLREKYSIFIEIRHCFKDLTKYTFHVYTTWEEYMEKLKRALKNEMPICNTYEEALEEGLYEALKLI